MGDSVAGRIRIDLLANVAQFNAGMREGAREGFGGFQQEAAKFDRWFQTRAQQQKRMADESANWHAAMGGILTGRGSRGSLRAPTYWGETASAGQSPWGETPGRDALLRAHIRLQDSLPWGKSFRTTLSAEAAATAAAVGATKNRVAIAIGSAAREIPGIGGVLSGIGGFAAGHPLATAGVAGVLGYAKHVHDRRALARQIKSESEMMGQSAEDASLIHVGGVDTRAVGFFQRAMVQRTEEQKEAFSKLKLNPDDLAAKPMVEALKDVATAFERTRNAADKTDAAMQLFGRGGMEMITILSDMNRMMDLAGDHEIIRAEDIQRVIAYDDAWKGAKNSVGSVFTAVDRGLGNALGGHEISTIFARSLEAVGHAVRFDEEGLAKAAMRWDKEDYRIEHADEIEKANMAQAQLAKRAKEEAEARKQAAKLAKEQRDALVSADGAVFRMTHSSEEMARLEFQRQLAKGGLRPGDRGYQERMAAYDTARWRSEAKGKSEAMATPEESLDKELERIDFLHRRRMLNEEEYGRLRNAALEDYFRREFELDAKALKRSLESPMEAFRRKRANLAKGEEAGMFADDPELLDEARRQTKRDLRAALGVRDPEKDYGKAFGELEEARREIGEEAYQRRRKELRRGALQDMTPEARDVSPVAAMQVGSREAYSALVSGMLGSQKDQLQREANAKLDRIEQAIRERGVNTVEVLN